MYSKRIFLLGPSHHYHFTTCALSKCTTYQTPLGDLKLDLETITELQSSGKFMQMTRSQDEDEHSLEMHLPYIYKMLSLYGFCSQPKNQPLTCLVKQLLRSLSLPTSNPHPGRLNLRHHRESLRSPLSTLSRRPNVNLHRLLGLLPLGFTLPVHVLRTFIRYCHSTRLIFKTTDRSPDSRKHCGSGYAVRGGCGDGGA
jgi:hypothetical protein